MANKFNFINPDFFLNKYINKIRTQVVEKARADAEKIKLIGAAEATAIENVGRSEAEAMRLKAAAYKQYGEAAILSLVFEALPKVRRLLIWSHYYSNLTDLFGFFFLFCWQIAAEVAAPLAKTDEIVMLSGSSNFSNEINKFVAQVPPAIQALTGVDLSDVRFWVSFSE